MPPIRSSRFVIISFAFLLLVSAALKLYASQLLSWEADYVPLVARGQAWLAGGDFPAVGTLSSVAAFNMPFLVWMQIPALLLTRDVRLVLVGTQLAFNLLTTCVTFRLGCMLFDERAAFLAATLYTFSEAGISSAYTAWAQLLLPGFFVMIACLMFLWKNEKRAWQIALTLVVATAAFMTHFSAVLLYPVIALKALLLRLPFNRRGLLGGLLLSALMLAPYLAYEARVDFVDLRAFFTQRSTISPEALAEYDQLKPGAKVQNADRAPVVDSPASPSTEAETSRLERGIAWLLSIPAQFIMSLRLPFSGDLSSLRQHQPFLHGLASVLQILLEASFWFGIIHAAHQCFRDWRVDFLRQPADRRGILQGWALAREKLVDSPAGHNLILLLFILAIAAGLILARAGPEGQPTYYTGLLSLQFLMCGYGLISLARGRKAILLIVALVLLFGGLGAFDRVIRVSQHDRATHSKFNLNLYANLHEAATWIASDWAAPGSITVSYDTLPELKHQWWILAWHTVDESYRMGMALDHLLKSYFDLDNSNRNPAGPADDPDYIVTSAPGLERYELARFQIAQFGALYVLKPS